jgi:hypothetical protein
MLLKKCKSIALSIYYRIFDVEYPTTGEIYKNKIDGYKYKVVSNRSNGYVLKRKNSKKSKICVHQDVFMNAKRVGVLEKD